MCGIVACFALFTAILAVNCARGASRVACAPLPAVFAAQIVPSPVPDEPRCSSLHVRRCQLYSQRACPVRRCSLFVTPAASCIEQRKSLPQLLCCSWRKPRCSCVVRAPLPAVLSSSNRCLSCFVARDASLVARALFVRRCQLYSQLKSSQVQFVTSLVAHRCSCAAASCIRSAPQLSGLNFAAKKAMTRAKKEKEHANAPVPSASADATPIDPPSVV